MPEVVKVQYLFLDVVGFTRDRSVQVQSDIVAALNDIVRAAVAAEAVVCKETIFVPTGDGMLIALLESSDFDGHIRLALQILKLIAKRNAETTDEARRFEVRFGLNQNSDNVVLDINNKRNVAGAGVSLAQRVMERAGGRQILVGQPVFEELNPREPYFKKFREFPAKDKHGGEFHVHQYVAEGIEGLDDSVPPLFAHVETPKPKLTKEVAYFFAHALANREFLLTRKKDAFRDEVSTILLAFLADDSHEDATASPYEERTPKAWGAGERTFPEQYAHYEELESSVLLELAKAVAKKYLWQYSEYFERNSFMPLFWLVNKEGKAKLIDEWPKIATRFSLIPKKPK